MQKEQKQNNPTFIKKNISWRDRDCNAETEKHLRTVKRRSNYSHIGADTCVICA